MNKLDDKTNALIYEFADKEIYNETIDFKCLKCDYEELNEDWAGIDEMWNKIDYPKMYCPKCVFTKRKTNIKDNKLTE